MTEHKFKVGQKVLYTTTRGTTSILTEITKVTPTGKVRVLCRPDLLIDNEGRVNIGKWHSAYIEIATPEQIKELENLRIKKQLLSKITLDKLTKLSIPQLQDLVKAVEEIQ